MNRVTLLLTIACLLLAGCGPSLEMPQVKGSGRVHTDTAPGKDAVSARQLLADVKTSPSLSMASYSRDRFVHWTDADADGCDTRDEVLAAESQLTPAPDCHAVESGNWYSPYDDTTVTVSGDMDVDHLVALAEAWRSGAANWPDSARELYANDLDYRVSLIAVTASSNRSKGDRDPASWMPPRRDYGCVYIAHWVAVKWRWNLTVDSAERSAIERIMKPCSDKSLMVADPGASMSIRAVGHAANEKPAAKPAPATPAADPAAKPTPGAAAQPSTCVQAHAAGIGPFRKGVDPEYANYRDGDKDGVVCE